MPRWICKDPVRARDGLLTVKQTAKALSLSQATVRRYIDRGTVEIATFGASVRVTQRSLDEMISGVSAGDADVIKLRPAS